MQTFRFFELMEQSNDYRKYLKFKNYIFTGWYWDTWAWSRRRSEKNDEEKHLNMARKHVGIRISYMVFEFHFKKIQKLDAFSPGIQILEVGILFIDWKM